MTEYTEVIYFAGRIDEAQLLQAMLGERGIESVIENEALQGAAGGLPLGEATSPRVRVASEDAAKAREIVKAFEMQERAAPRPDVEFTSDLVAGGDDWTEWPTCPECRHRRQTECPVCHAAGTGFPLAEYNVPAPAGGVDRSDEEALPLLMCATCDEAFEPRFYQVCPWCGLEFDSGIHPPAVDTPREKISPRVWLVIAILAAVSASLSAYFWWLTR